MPLSPARRRKACPRREVLGERSWGESTPFLLVLGERALELVAQLVRHRDVRAGLALVHGIELRLHDMVVLLEGLCGALRALGILRDDGERSLSELQRRKPCLALHH